MTRILIVDDHPLMRKGLIMSLSDDPEFEVCAQASDAEEAMSLVESENPDLVIVDISLPGMSGLELIKQLHAIRPELFTLVVSRHDESLYDER